MSTESSANDESECVSPHDLSMASSESSSQHQEDRGGLWRRNYAAVGNKINKEEKKKEKEKKNTMTSPYGENVKFNGWRK